MSKDLTNSDIARQNILNNQYALQEIQKSVGISGILFENEFKFTKKQLADFFEVSERTVEILSGKIRKNWQKTVMKLLQVKD